MGIDPESWIERLDARGDCISKMHGRISDIVPCGLDSQQRERLADVLAKTWDDGCDYGQAQLRDHIDADHGIMVQLGLIADAAVKMLEHVNMDTDEDRELHARATGALRGRLTELAAAMKEANEAANPSSPAAGTGEDERP